MANNPVQEGQATPQENKMGTMPVGRLLATMGLPMALSMLVQALYNVVDSYFVSQLSEEALTAVSLAFPMQNFMIAVASGTAVGVNALLSRSLGCKDLPEAQRSAHNGLFLSLLGTGLFLLFGLFFSRAFFETQTAIAAIVDGGEQYLRIVTVFSFGIFFEIMLERLLQSTGRTIYSMIPDGGRHHQHHPGPHHDLRPAGLPHDGCGGCGGGHGHRPNSGHAGGAVLQPAQERGAAPEPEEDAAQRPYPADHPGGGPALYPDDVHRVGDDLRHEPNPAGLHLHRAVFGVYFTKAYLHASNGLNNAMQPIIAATTAPGKPTESARP